MDEIEQTFLSNAVENALIKLRILSLNSTCSEIFDPTHSYSIADIINQKVQLLQRLSQVTAGIDALHPGEPARVRASFDDETHLKLLSELSELENESNTLEQTLRELQEELYVEQIIIDTLI